MNKQRIIERLKCDDPAGLFNEANSLRKAYFSDEIYLRGIIEFSNYCCRSCVYCGLRKENKMLTRRRMPPDEIVNTAGKIAASGVGTVVLQSGDDFWYTPEVICEIISRIKKENASLAVTLSIGERPLAEYKAFKHSGADRYLLKHETSNRQLYKRLHPGQTLDRRIKILQYLKQIGFETGAGSIIGLPGQGIEDLADDILLMRKLGVDMAGIGPFISHSQTPLAGYPSGSLDLTLRVLALTRIVIKGINLPATTALATLNPAIGQLLALKAGCNVIMPDFTPELYRKDYIIYDNKQKINLKTAQKLIRDR